MNNKCKRKEFKADILQTILYALNNSLIEITVKVYQIKLSHMLGKPICKYCTTGC